MLRLRRRPLLRNGAQIFGGHVPTMLGREFINFGPNSDIQTSESAAPQSFRVWTFLLDLIGEHDGFVTIIYRRRKIEVK